MDEESRYRVESEDELDDQEERKGLFRPLPKSEPKGSKRRAPIVRFLGIEMTEPHRDLLVMLLMPCLAGIINAAIFANVIIRVFDSSLLYVFVLPAIVAIPIGLTVPQAGKALLSGFLIAVFFAIFFLLFLAAPGLIAPEIGVEEFLASGGVITSVYFLFIVLASLLGSLIGIVVREMF